MIEIINVQEDEKLPATNVNTEDNNLPKKCVQLSGGPSIEVEALSVTENGTYTAPEGKAYTPVTVEVPDVPAVLESLTVTENGIYTPEQGVDGFNSVNVSVLGGIPVADAEIVEAIPTPVAPEVLPEGKLYIIPDGTQYVPTFPRVSGCDYYFITCDNVTLFPQNWVDKTRLDNSTKFWLFLSSAEGKCRRDAIQTVSWGGSTSDIMPEHIYEYDTAGTFAWTELDLTDPDVIASFALAPGDPGAIIHNILECVYTNYNIFRYTVGNLEFDKSLSILNSEGKIYNVYYINSFKCYIVTEGTAVYDDTYNMYQLINAYTGGN